MKQIILNLQLLIKSQQEFNSIKNTSINETNNIKNNLTSFGDEFTGAFKKVGYKIQDSILSAGNTVKEIFYRLHRLQRME